MRSDDILDGSTHQVGIWNGSTADVVSSEAVPDASVSEPRNLALSLEGAIEGWAPELGGRILVLARPFFEMMLRGEKVYEIRCQRLKPGLYHVGHHGRIYGVLTIADSFVVATDEQWQAMRHEHRHPSGAMPYKRTCALRVTAPLLFRSDVLYQHHAGSIGTCRFEPVSDSRALHAVNVKKRPASNVCEESAQHDDVEMDAALQCVTQSAASAGIHGFAQAAARGEMMDALRSERQHRAYSERVECGVVGPPFEASDSSDDGGAPSAILNPTCATDDDGESDDNGNEHPNLCPIAYFDDEVVDASITSMRFNDDALESMALADSATVADILDDPMIPSADLPPKKRRLRFKQPSGAELFSQPSNIAATTQGGASRKGSGVLKRPAKKEHESHLCRGSPNVPCTWSSSTLGTRARVTPQRGHILCPMCDDAYFKDLVGKFAGKYITANLACLYVLLFQAMEAFAGWF